MRNLWKGLAVGAVSGAAIGLAVDLLDRAARGGADLSRELAARVPDLTEKITNTAREAAGTAWEAAGTAREATGIAAEKAKRALNS